MTIVHASAVIETGAQLAADVEIGPGCVVGAKVRMASGVKLGPHVVVLGETEIGAGTVVHSHAVLGGSAQYRGDAGDGARLVIGAGNVIREHVTMNSGTAKGGGITQVGDNGYFMAYSHVAHDCHVGNTVTFANAAALGGHCVVGDGVNIGGLSAVLQFVRIGRNAFVSGIAGVQSDVIPFGLAIGAPAALEGLNVVGLKRSGIGHDRLHALRAAYRYIFRGPGLFKDRVGEAAERWPSSPEVSEVLAFIRAASKRPICMPARNSVDTGRD